MGKVVALILLFAVAGCASVPAPTPSAPSDPRAVWCGHNQPRRLSLEVVAAMSVDEMRDAVAHNRKGEAWCGWRP